MFFQIHIEFVIYQRGCPLFLSFCDGFPLQMMKKISSTPDFAKNPLYQQFMDPYFDFPTSKSKDE